MQVEDAGVREGAELAVHGLGTDEVLVHGAHQGAALAVTLKSEQVLGVLAVVGLELAMVAEDLKGTTGGLGADGVVFRGADAGTLGRSGGGRDRQEDGESDGGLDEHGEEEEGGVFFSLVLMLVVLVLLGLLLILDRMEKKKSERRNSIAIYLIFECCRCHRVTLML